MADGIGKRIMTLSFLAAIFVISSVQSQNKTRPVVHLLAIESTGALDGKSTYHVRYLKALFEIAMEDAQAKFGEFIDIRFKHRETLCGPTLIGAQAAEEYYNGDVDVFIGPICNDAVIPLGYMALTWNLPIISPRGNTRLIRNTTIFPNIISLHPFDKFELVRFTVYLLNKYKWEHITVFTDKDDRELATTGDSYFAYLETSSLFWSYIPIYSTTFTNADYDAKLKEASLSSRVFVMIMSIDSVRLILLRASSLGMTSGDYVYLVPEFQGLSKISADVWRRNDSTDVKARKAFRSVLFINIMTPPLTVYDHMILRLNTKLFGSNTSLYVAASNDEDIPSDGAGHSENVEYIKGVYHYSHMCKDEDVYSDKIDVQPAILSGYYNAIHLYLSIVNETLSQGGNIDNGLEMVRTMSNRTFKGIAGTIHINADGHSDTDMALVDMTDPWNGTFERVGIYSAVTAELKINPGVKISWPGGDGPVEDIPECGFTDMLCETYAEELVLQKYPAGVAGLQFETTVHYRNEGGNNSISLKPTILLLSRPSALDVSETDSTNLAIGLSTSISIILIAVAIGVSLVLRVKFAQRKKQLSWWKIEIDELQPMKRNMTKSTFSSILRQSNTNATETSLSSCTVCMYKGNLVRQHTLSRGHFPVNARLLREFEEIRDLNHPNLLRVVGACLEGEKKVLITEHCPKGSLQEVLMEDSFYLDNVFCLSILMDIVREMLVNDNRFELDVCFQVSLISDIVRALTYIHKRSLRYHGRLTSEVCMIDPRFSVKVGYYGLPTIYDTIQLQSKEQSKEKDCLWVAPELLRSGEKGSQEGDAYSLAIIMSEVISREEPYSNDKEYLTTQEVLTKVRVCEDPPFRPAIAASPDLVQLETLMKQCWDEDPEKRPSLYKIAGILHTLMSKFNKAGSLVDNLLQRLEKYSTNLEKIVDEKVDELRQEKHKSEELLRQMLPKMVADRLKAGLTVEPELFECVTIYFSDIVGFTEMCSELKPVQIINLLNDLYSCFDGIIGNYDVYKVETIGDGYMVVSGLPTRNGNEHARQIARMSLALLNVISSFTPIETSEDRLMLRVGLHSGPVCAGVVGLKMPRYCLFGDTVNTASRMETNGMEWKIHMSGSTADILKLFGNFIMKRRGEIEIKGKGMMETFWLLGEKDSNPEIVVTGHQQQNFDTISKQEDLLCQPFQPLHQPPSSSSSGI